MTKQQILFSQIWIVILAISSCTTLFPEQEPTSVKRYLIEQPSRLYDLRWENNQIIQSSSHQDFLGLTDEHLFFYSLNDERASIDKLDVATGSLDWTIHTEAIVGFAYNTQYLFVSGVRDTPLTKVNAYSLETGDNVWTANLVRVGNISLTANDRHVHTSAGLTLDASTGQTVDALDGHIAFLIENDMRYWGLFSLDSFHAFDIESEAVVWSTDLDSSLHREPIFAGDVILLKTRNSQVHALDKSSGLTLWETDAIVVSNVTAANEFAYYLTVDSTLQIVEIQTGKLVDTIQFNPSIKDLSPSELANTPFNVEASSSHLVIYFSDSKQLFAFDLDKRLVER